MGTKVDCKTYLPGFYSMRDLNEDSSSSSWHVSYGDKPTTNGPYYNGFMSRTIMDCYPGYGKDALKQKMLEHEAVFKNQVYELHRLYRIQRDMMEEVKTKELHKLRASMEPSSSSSLRGSQIDSRKWHMAGFPLLNSGHDRTSISGVEIENSPMSCTKGYNNTQPRQFLFQNGSYLKESEPLDSRPLKVRKKLFDLELPADECIDTDEGEKLPESKISELSSYAPVGNLKIGVESRKAGGIRLADLNEPVDIEEAPLTVDFVDHSSLNGGTNQSAKLNPGYLGVNEKTLHIRDGSLSKPSIDSRVNEKGWFSHLYEAGCSRSNLSSITQSPQKEKMPIHSHPLPDTFFSSCFASSWAQSTSSFTQKLTTSPIVEPFGGKKWQINASSKSNACLGGELTTTNGLLYHGSAKVPSPGFDYINCSRDDNVFSDRSNNRVLGYFKNGSSDSKPIIDIDLNVADDGKRKPEDHFSALPWLKSKPNEAANKFGSKSEIVTDLNQPFDPKVTLDSSDCEILRKNEAVETRSVKKILGIPIFETGALKNGCSDNVGKEKKTRIIDINLECEPDEEITVEKPTLEKESEQSNGAFIRDYIDLNSCVCHFEDISYESKADSVKKTFEIDLEAPVENEDNNPSTDLLQNKDETLQDEILRNAAETIFSISTSCPKTHANPISHPPNMSLSESLIWFVDALSNELEINESTFRERSAREIPNKMDDFEAMTLQLQETKEEDYMPAPFVPEFQIPDETGPATITRARRGQSRRGRQRRDFQRDILPGLTTLSRHEVSEDIQTFGGLMRATGHHWVSGLTRKNGPGRGRRRAAINNVSNQACAPLVREISNIEGGLEDRSLTGWGKTTRRPRRQRCPTGNNNNSHVVVLT